MDSPNRGASVLIGSGGDSAGIQYHHVGFPRRTCLRHAMCRKLTFQRGSVCLSGAASKAVDKKSGHEGYYNGVSGAIPEQQLTTNAVGGCILLARFKRFKVSLELT
jgi:hypothetical protein